MTRKSERKSKSVVTDGYGTFDALLLRVVKKIGENAGEEIKNENGTELKT